MNGQSLKLMATVMNVLLERHILHINYEKDLDSENGYYHVGMIIPIDFEKFSKEKDLSQQPLVISRHSSWGLISRKYATEHMETEKSWEKYSTTDTNPTCPIEHLLLCFNMLAYRQGIAEYTDGIGDAALKYFGCRSCGDHESHVIIPFFHALGYSAVTNFSDSALTFSGVFKHLRKVADNDIKVRYVLSWSYINHISMCYKINKLSGKK